MSRVRRPHPPRACALHSHARAEFRRRIARVMGATFMKFARVPTT